MIEIVARSTIKSDCVDIFRHLAHELIINSRQEPGCISYMLCEDISDSNSFAFVETWQDQAAIDSHNQSLHFTSIVPRFADLLAVPMDVKLYRIVE